MFTVKDIFLTLQGEGHNVGRRAVFVRFAGCNMWSGIEKDRSRGKAGCALWCDTDFYGGKKMTQEHLLDTVAKVWGDFSGSPFVVLTGGEPGLQLTEDLMAGITKMGFSAAVETNGSVELPKGVYWKTVSPKHEEIVVTSGNELKLIFPTLPPEEFIGLDFRYFYLQPLNNRHDYALKAFEYIKAHPQWRLSAQMHKHIGIA